MGLVRLVQWDNGTTRQNKHNSISRLSHQIMNHYFHQFILSWHVFTPGLIFLFGAHLCLLLPHCAAAESPLTALQAASLCQEAEQLFQEGNAQYAAGNQEAWESWSKAARRYERLRQDGNIHNGALYYNLGNIYFRLGDLGRAVLNYRRAQQLMPNDINLHQNLTFVKSRCRHQIAETEQTKILKTVFFWHHDLPSAWREKLFFLAFAAIWILAGSKLWRPGRAWSTWGVVMATIMTMVMAASLALDEWNLRQNPPGVIVSDEVTARKGDSESYEPSFTEPLHAGTEFILKNKRQHWLEITLPDKQTCWIPAKDAEMVNQ